MNPVVDFVLVALIVLFSVVIASYTLSPLKAKRWMLSKISRFVSLRFINWLLPNQCGCDGCPVRDNQAAPPIPKPTELL